MVEQTKYKTQGAKFKALCEEAGLSQLKVANCLGVDTNYIAELENGTRLLADFTSFKKTGAKFKSLRKATGLTQEQVAKCLGVDKSYISKIEKGERVLYGDELIKKARQLFLCPIEELFEEEDSSIKRYCSISFRSSQISTDALVQLSNIQSIVETQFLMDYIEKNSVPALVVPEGEDEFEFYMNLRNNFDPVAYKKQHSKENPPLPSCDLETEPRAMVDQEINENRSPLHASQLRQFFGVPCTEPIDIFKIALEKIPNLTVIFADLDESISGVCYQGEKSHVIVINQNMSWGRQRFAMAHELFHLYFDHSCNKSISSKHNASEPLERAADVFASHLLLPMEALTNFLETHKAYSPHTDKLQLILQLENTFQISHSCALSRLAEIMNLSELRADNDNIANLAQSYGFTTDTYQIPQHAHHTNGYYFKQLNHLYKAQYIHAQRAHSFLEISQNFNEQELQSIKQHYDRYR